MNDYFVSSITYSILPPLIASSLQNILYSNNVLTRQHPQSRQFQRDRQLIYTVLVLAFLFYTTYTAYVGLSPTYYDLLGVSTSATPSELRSQFKILSKSLHPDKSTTSNGAFLAIRHAYQILLNPVKRKAYDLFGPSISQWDLRSEREFLFRGICWGVLPRYLISFLTLQVWGLFGRNGQVKYWRYLLFITVFVLEIHLLIHGHPPLLGYFRIKLPRFQLLSLLHSVSLSLTLSLEHLAPLYTPSVLSSTLLSKAEMAAVNALGESNRSFSGEFGPVLDGVERSTDQREIIEKLKNDIVQSLINERVMRATAE